MSLFDSSTITMKHDNNFDALRLLGASVVVISHEFALSGRAEPMLLGLKLGTVGVLIFFAISGFLVTASWSEDRNLQRFFARRLLRIWPALAVCVLSCILLVVLLLVPPEDRSAIPGIVKYLLPNFVFAWRDAIFFQSNPYPYINATLWTITIEVQCYVVLSILGFIARARLRLGMVIVSAVCLSIYMRGYQLQGALSTYAFFQLHDSLNLPIFFLAGSLIYLIPALQTTRATFVATVAGAACFLTGFAGLGWACALPPIVLQIGRMSWPVARRAARWGDLSYGIYLWGWPVQQVVVLLLQPKAPYLLLLATTIAVLVPLALCSWHVIEKRCLRLKPRASNSSVRLDLPNHVASN